MIELSAALWILALLFGVVGLLRGWTRELVSLAGIILGLFTLYQFDPLLRGTLLASVPRDQVFLVQAVLFIGITFFAYQTRALGRFQRSNERDSTTERILGGILGFINGYLIWGTLWYFMDINQYPLAPFIIAPAPNSISAQQISLLPLVILAGGPAGSADWLSLLMILLFIGVLIII